MGKINFIHEETPLHKLNFGVGNHIIYMKRDDLIGFAGGGNKVRLFEYIAADVKKKNADKIITFGSVHSNHIRVASVVAAYLGVACDLIIIQDKTDEMLDNNEGNMSLISCCPNVHIEYCSAHTAHDFIDYYLASQSTNYYWIPGGGHMSIAVRGYMDCSKEMLAQFEDKSMRVDAIFCPCGTGTTQAGLIAGLRESIPVYGISVARDAERCRQEIVSLLKIYTKEEFNESTLHILPNYSTYGAMTSSIRKIINEVVISDGIFLDPIYNAKSFLQMIDFLKKSHSSMNVVYINTGGYPNLFRMNNDF